MYNNILSYYNAMSRELSFFFIYDILKILNDPGETMKIKALVTGILLIITLHSNAETRFINNKIIANSNHHKELQTPYYKSIANLKKDYQDVSAQIGNFSKFTQKSIMDIRKEKYDFFHRKNWSAPKIATYSYQNFGIWDAAFLWYTLENYLQEDNALFFHHHQNDPGIKLFKREVNRFSNLDSQYKNFLYRIGQKGFKEDRDKYYLPNSVTPVVALSEHILHYNIDSDNDTLRISVEKYQDHQTDSCEQWKDSNYLSVNIKCIESRNSEKKINQFFIGETDALILQSDELTSYLEENPIVQGFQGVILRKEYLFMMVPKGSEIYRLDDLKNTKHGIKVFSGSLKNTLERIARKLPEYKEVFSDIKVSSGADSYIENEFKYGNNILFISCDLKKCPTVDLMNDEYSEKYEMIPVNFWQLLNERDPMGNPIYTQTVVPYKYPNIQNPDIYQKHSIQHIGFYNYLIISDYWFEYHKEHIRELENFLKNL